MTPSVRRLVRWSGPLTSVCHNFLDGREVTLHGFYRSTTCYIEVSERENPSYIIWISLFSALVPDARFRGRVIDSKMT